MASDELITFRTMIMIRPSIAYRYISKYENQLFGEVKVLNNGDTIL